MDEFDIIETPENVDLQRRLAGIGSRFVAGLLDTLLIVAALLVVMLVSLAFGVSLFAFGTDLAHRADAWVLALFILLGFLIYWGYFVLFETWMNGQTPGKRYMRIRVVQQEGGAVSFNAVAIRNLLRAVDIVGVYAVAGIVMFLTRKVQRLGDLAAGTVVISEEVPDYAARPDTKATVPDEISPQPAALEATHVEAAGVSPAAQLLAPAGPAQSGGPPATAAETAAADPGTPGTPLEVDTLAALERRLEELMTTGPSPNHGAVKALMSPARSNHDAGAFPGNSTSDVGPA